AMRHEPSVISWVIRCRSRDELEKVVALLQDETRPEAVFFDSVTTYPAGFPLTWQQRHTVGEYFQAIRLLPPGADDPPALRVAFPRGPGADRFWKDLMVRILGSARRAGENISVARTGSEDQGQELTGA